MDAPTVADETDGPPSVIVFEIPTARRIGAQLRAGGGSRLDEIRYAVRVLMGLSDTPGTGDPDPSLITDNLTSRE